MAELDVLNIREVTQRLIAPTERWGWEYHEPAAVRPYSQPRPQWSEPRGPSLPTADAKYLRAKAAVPKRAIIAGVVLVIGVCAGKYGIVLDLAAIGLACFWFIPLITARQKADAMITEHQQIRQQEWNAHGAADAQWQQQEATWRAAEEQRVADNDRWYPIAPHAVPSRIDVFGGTAEGQARFLVTLGSGLLATGTRLTVLDLTERDVAAPMAVLAQRAPFPFQHVSLPADLHQAGLLDGMNAEDVAELVAEALHTRRGTNEGSSLRDLDADILRNVATRLDGTITFDRLAAALRVVQRVEEAGSRDSVLSAQERRRLAEYVDVIGSSERNLTQVQDLRSTLESITQAGAPALEAAAAGTETAAAPGLTVYVSEDPNNRRRDLLNRLVVQTLIHRLRHGEIAGDVLAIAGADHLGTEALQRLHRSAQRATVRLVLLIEHLSEEFEPYLGDAESASIFMRMQNTKEAGRAAEHIGRGHKFTLTQLNRTEGTSTMHGTNSTRSTNQSWSDSHGRGGGHGGGNWNKSDSYTYGTSDSVGTNSSSGTNESSGETVSRVYEFTVEPTTFQGLDPSSFVLVEPTPGGGRRVIAGTCDPAVLTMSAVSPTPLSDADRADPTGDANSGPLGQVNIVDPNRELGWFADRLVAAGYLLSYQTHPREAILSGWLITGHRDGRPLVEAEIMSHR